MLYFFLKKRAKKKSGHAVVEWGKHGILVDSDIYTKNEEFRSWLLEEKRINADSLSKPKLKDIFRQVFIFIFIIFLAT